MPRRTGTHLGSLVDMLIPEDDFPLHQAALPLAHTMDGHPNAYDRFWFNGYTEEYYFAVALGLYPNRGVIDAAFSVVDAGQQRSVFSGDRLTGRETEVGAVRIEILEPLRVNRVIVNAPQQGLRADLMYTRRSDAFEEPRQTLHDGPRIFLDVTRATQVGTWEGWIETPDRRIEVLPGTYGTKDRSWGVRPVGEALPGAPGTRAPQLCFWWAPLNFENGAVHFMSFDDSHGRPLSRSVQERPLEGLGDAIHHSGHLVLQTLSGTRRPQSAQLVLDDESIGLEPLFRFHMRGAGYGHPTYSHGRWHGEAFTDGEVLVVDDLDPLAFPNLHIQQIVRATRGTQVGLGVLESIIVGPYTPMGLEGLLNGA